MTNISLRLSSLCSVLVWKVRLKFGSGGSYVVAWSSHKVLRNLGLLAKDSTRQLYHLVARKRKEPNALKPSQRPS